MLPWPTNDDGHTKFLIFELATNDDADIVRLKGFYEERRTAISQILVLTCFWKTKRGVRSRHDFILIPPAISYLLCISAHHKSKILLWNIICEDSDESELDFDEVEVLITSDQIFCGSDFLIIYEYPKVSSFSFNIIK